MADVLLELGVGEPVLIALAIYVGIALAKRWAPSIWYRVPEGWRWLPPLLGASLSAGADVLFQGGEPRHAAAQALMVALAAMGVQSARREAQSGSGPLSSFPRRLPLIPLLLGLSLAAPPMVGCALLAPSRTPEQDGRDLRAVITTAEAAADVLRPHVADLVRLEHALSVLRAQAKATERDDDAIDAAVLDLLDVLQAGLDVAQEQGAEVPREVAAGLVLLRFYVASR